MDNLMQSQHKEDLAEMGGANHGKQGQYGNVEDHKNRVTRENMGHYKSD